MNKQPRLQQRPALRGLSNFFYRRLVLVQNRLNNAVERVEDAREECQQMLVMPRLVDDRRQDFEYRR